MVARSRNGSGKIDDDIRLAVDVEGRASATVVDVEVVEVVEVVLVVDVVVGVVVCLLVGSVVVVDSLAGVVFLEAEMLLIGAMSSKKRSSEWDVEEEEVEEEVEADGEETEGAVEEPSSWSMANQVKSWFLSGAAEEERGSREEVREDRETTLPLPGRS